MAAKRTVDEKRARIRARIETIEQEMLRWERARVSAVDPEFADEARARVATLKARWDRERLKLEALRDQLTLPWLGREVQS